MKSVSPAYIFRIFSRFVSIFTATLIITLICLNPLYAIYADNKLPPVRKMEIGRSTPDEILKHADRCSDIGMHKEAVEALEQLKHSNMELTVGQKSYCLYLLSHSYFAQGSYQLSLNNLFDLLRLPKPDSLKFHDIFARMILSGTYMRFHAPQQADSVLKIVEKEIKRYNFNPKINKTLRRNYYLEKSTTYADRGEWGKYFEMLELSDKYSDPSTKNELRRVLDYGIYYMCTGEPIMAEQYFQRIIDTPEWSYDKMAAMTNYSKMLLSQKRYSDAVRIADEALRLLENHTMDQMKASLLYFKGMALYNLGRADEAVPVLNRSSEISDSLFNWHTEHSVIGSAKDFERDIENRKFEDIQKARNQSFIAIIALSVLVVVFIITLVFISRKNSILKENVETLRKELDNIEQRHSDKMQDTLEDLSNHHRRIVALTLKLAQVSDLIRSVLHTGQANSDSDPIAQLREGMKCVDMNRNVWETFDIFFEQTRPGFYNKIRDMHPDLTKGELRMCAYMLTGLSTKEIAAITNRSSRTVETVKYRLRKKLNITEGISLQKYLDEFV